MFFMLRGELAILSSNLRLNIDLLFSHIDFKGFKRYFSYVNQGRITKICHDDVAKLFVYS